MLFFVFCFVWGVRGLCWLWQFCFVLFGGFYGVAAFGSLVVGVGSRSFVDIGVFVFHFVL